MVKTWLRGFRQSGDISNHLVCQACFVPALDSPSAINKAAVFVQPLALWPWSLAEAPHDHHTEEKCLPPEGVGWEKRPDPANLHSEEPTASISIRRNMLTSLRTQELWHTLEGVSTVPGTHRHGSPTDAFNHR